ncbi:hypothetical protein ACS0TY_014308 [Phlomoides rotata]
MVQIFSFAWLELVSHGSFMPKLLTANGQKGWPYFQRLLVDFFQFMEPCSSWIRFTFCTKGHILVLFLFRLAWELFYFAMSQICYDHYWLRLDFQKICMILYNEGLNEQKNVQVEAPMSNDDVNAQENVHFKAPRNSMIYDSFDSIFNA